MKFVRKSEKIPKISQSKFFCVDLTLHEGILAEKLDILSIVTG